jgi:ssDNA-binding replication factor A large subunit
MSRTPARLTQADIARSLPAAKQTGAGAVYVLPDGTIRISLDSTTDKTDVLLEPEGEVVL